MTHDDYNHGKRRPTAATLDERVFTLEREMGELRKVVLVGNGQPSLVERFASLERAQQTQTWLLRVIVGAVVTNLIGIAFILIRAKLI